jgi:amidase
VKGLSSLPAAEIADPQHVERMLRMEALQSAVLKAMADERLDALVFPMKTQEAPAIGDTRSAPARIVSGGSILGSITGFPSITVPAGFTANGLPVGVERLGRPFDEWSLLRYASDYEAATGHRRAPSTAPALAPIGARR